MSDEIEYETSDNVITVEKKYFTKCRHDSLIFDPDETFVECKECGTHLNPMVAIERLLSVEARWRRTMARAKIAIEEAEKKTRTRCEHCRKFTKVRIDIKDHRVLTVAMDMERQEKQDDLR